MRRRRLTRRLDKAAQQHTTRGAISGAIKKKLGLPVQSERVDGRGTVYRLTVWSRSADPGRLAETVGRLLLSAPLKHIGKFAPCQYAAAKQNLLLIDDVAEFSILAEERIHAVQLSRPEVQRIRVMRLVHRRQIARVLNVVEAPLLRISVSL